MLPPPKGHLFCFGLGYSATRLATRLASRGWIISGTRRSEKKISDQRQLGYNMHVLDGNGNVGELSLKGVTHAVVSVPPGPEPKGAGDPILEYFGDLLTGLPTLSWLGYLSTTGVYGNSDGAWVDEMSALQPSAARSVRRAEAEKSWQEYERKYNLPLHIFRLAGIYGPGRNALEQVIAGKARRIVKPGHQFSRIHVDDIATILEASIARPNPGAVYNVCDDEPAAPSDVVNYACGLLGVEPPAKIDFEQKAL